MLNFFKKINTFPILFTLQKDQLALQREKMQVQLEDERRMRQALGLEPKNNEDLPNLNQYEMEEVYIVERKQFF